MVDFSWCGLQTSSGMLNIGPLALIAPLLDRLALRDIIDRHLPGDPQLEYSHGEILTLLLAARLAKPTALVNIAAWAEKTGAELLWNISANKLNDDRIGRSLDAFFEQRHSIQAAATMHALRLANLPLTRIHFDPTHVLFHGDYACSKPRTSDILTSPMRSSAQIDPGHITGGYLSKGQKMLQVANAAVVDDVGAVSIFNHVLDGNQNSHSAIHEHFQLLRHHLPLPDNLLLISDRGTFSVRHAQRLADHGYRVLCSAVWRDFRDVYDSHISQLDWHRASYLSIEQRRRRDTHSSLPLEHYDIAVVNHTLVDPASKTVLPCRLLFVYSSADAKACQHTRRRDCEKIRAGLDKIVALVGRGHCSAKLDNLPQRIAKLLGDKAAGRYVRWELQPLSRQEQAALPAPRCGFKRPTQRFVYTLDESAALADAAYDGLSVLVTTAPLTDSGDSLFTKFKEQNFLESGHHQFKTPLAVSPVFLKSPRRVEALVCLLQIALQAYQMLERLYRQSLPKDAPIQEKRTTAETLLRAFEVHGVFTRQTPIGRIIHSTAPNCRQARILQQLNMPTPGETLSKSLPEAPEPYAALSLF
jgi:transposase